MEVIEISDNDNNDNQEAVKGRIGQTDANAENEEEEDDEDFLRCKNRQKTAGTLSETETGLEPGGESEAGMGVEKRSLGEPSLHVGNENVSMAAITLP